MREYTQRKDTAPGGGLGSLADKLRGALKTEPQIAARGPEDISRILLSRHELPESGLTSGAHGRISSSRFEVFDFISSSLGGFRSLTEIGRCWLRRRE